MVSLVVKNVGKSIFFSGILVLTSIAIIGMAYLTKLSWSKECADKFTDLEKKITRTTMITLWSLLFWIIIGITIQTIWMGGVGACQVNLDEVAQHLNRGMARGRASRRGALGILDVPSID